MGYARIFSTFMIATALCLGGAAHAQQKRADNALAADSGTFGVGDALPASDVHIITKPGLYGLGPEPADSKYAVAAGKLIRINPESGKVLSILRSQTQVLD